MGKSKKKEEIPGLLVPTNLGQCSELIRRVGSLERGIEKINMELAEKIEKLKSEADAKINELTKLIATAAEGIYRFAEENKETLIEERKKKTIKLSTGDFGWRINPPSVSIKSTAKALAQIKSLGFTDLIRIKEEVNKEAILEKPEVAKKIKGVSIRRDEEFFIRPAEEMLEVVHAGKKIKIKVIEKKKAKKK